MHPELDPPRLVKDRLIQNLKDKVNCTMNTNNRRCNACPLYGQDLISAASSIIKGPKNFPIISNYSSFVETSEFTICDLGHQLLPGRVLEGGLWGQPTSPPKKRNFA